MRDVPGGCGAGLQPCERVRSAQALRHALLVVVCSLAALSSRSAIAQSDAWPLANHFFIPPIAFSPDGRFVALGGSVGSPADFCPSCIGRLHVWDLRAGQRVFVNDDRPARVMSAVFSHDGRLLVTGHADGVVIVRNTADFTVVSRYRCCASTWIRALALSPDDTLLAIGAQNGELILWNVADDIRNRGSIRLSRSLTGHQFGISSLAFDAAGGYLLSSADDQHVRRWNVQTGASYEFSRGPKQYKAHRGMVKSVVLLNGGRQALTAAYWEGGTTKDYESITPPDQILRLWDVDRGLPLRSYPLTWGIRCCMQRLAGRNAVAFLKATSWNEAPVLQVFNIDTGGVEHEFAPAMGESFHTMAMHPGGRFFVVGFGEGQYVLLEAQTGRRIARLVSVDEGWAVLGADGRIDFSDGFKRWPCRNDVQQACAGGRDAAPAKGLLPALIEQP